MMGGCTKHSCLFFFPVIVFEDFPGVGAYNSNDTLPFPESACAPRFCPFLPFALAGEFPGPLIAFFSQAVFTAAISHGFEISARRRR